MFQDSPEDEDSIPTIVNAISVRVASNFHRKRSYDEIPTQKNAPMGAELHKPSVGEIKEGDNQRESQGPVREQAYTPRTTDHGRSPPSGKSIL